jgi:DNA-binding LytR/AlgR family response regulator
MKVLLIEDEAPAARRLRQLITESDSSMEILDTIDSVEASVKWLKLHPAPDMIFMDIQLADGLSFDIFSIVKISSPVIFTTAYDEYAIRAFEVNCIDYLLKPIEKSALQKSINKFKEFKEVLSGSSKTDVEAVLATLNLRQKAYKSRFLVKMGEKLQSISTNDIAYFTAEEKVVLLFTHEGRKYLVDYSLDELEKMLDPDCFFRINRQFIVQINAIAAIHNYFNGKLKLQIVPETSKETIISRDKAPVFKSWLDR